MSEQFQRTLNIATFFSMMIFPLLWNGTPFLTEALHNKDEQECCAKCVNQVWRMLTEALHNKDEQECCAECVNQVWRMEYKKHKETTHLVRSRITNFTSSKIQTRNSSLPITLQWLHSLLKAAFHPEIFALNEE